MNKTAGHVRVTDMSEAIRVKKSVLCTYRAFHVKQMQLMASRHQEGTGMHIEIQGPRPDHPDDTFRVVEVKWDGKRVILGDGFHNELKARLQAIKAGRKTGLPVINRVGALPPRSGFSEQA